MLCLVSSMLDIDFDGNLGKIEYGDEKRISVTVENTSSNLIRITKVQSTYPDTKIEGGLGTINRDEHKTFELVWAPGPNSLGKRTGKIEIEYEEYV